MMRDGMGSTRVAHAKRQATGSNGVVAYKDPDTGKVETDPRAISKEMATAIIGEAKGLLDIASRGVDDSGVKERLTKVRRELWGIVRGLSK